MRVLRCAILLGLLASSRAAAEGEVRCTPDPAVDLGVAEEGAAGAPGDGEDGVACRSADGAVVPAHRSGVGILTVRDADGNLVYGDTSASGITTFRPDPAAPLRPSTAASAPDGVGGVTLRDEAGNLYNPPTDGLGNSTFHTEDGRVMRCHTVGPGHTVCD
jgi:hypothetical protein